MHRILTALAVSTIGLAPLGGAVTQSAVAAPPSLACGQPVGGLVTCTSTRAGETEFTVPSGVRALHVRLVGAPGGPGVFGYTTTNDAGGMEEHWDPAPGGLGGEVQGDVNVGAGEQLFLSVGGRGLATGSYADTLDARAYAWAQESGDDVRELLAQTLHDLAVDDALHELTEQRRVVGVMGGHAAPRGSAGYRDAALLGWSLAAAGFTVATGGGPGAMEAANLGAYLVGQDAGALDQALAVLAEVPSFSPSVDAWARVAFDVRRRWPDGGTSLGVPTWFYGHEPPNAFAQQIAKYFKNAIREDVLLAVAHAGTVFLPGRGGTVQEVFQDACENYYADTAKVAPMVLVGRSYWTEELPVWPLLQALADGRPMAGHLHLVDDPAEVPARLAT